MLVHRPHGPVVVAVALLAVGGCTRSSDALPEPERTSVAAGSPAETPAPSTVPQAAPATASTSAAVTPASSAAPATVPIASVTQVPEVAEIGVPGLDSDDAFCASWSRFAGSFQVVAVTAAFGSGPPEQPASLETAAAPTVTSSYRELLANWPTELETEVELVADEFLGPFARRLEDARSALTEVGADQATVDEIAAAWVEGLARRDPSSPEFVVDLPDATWEVIDEAARTFAARRVAFGADPSLVTNVSTPLTEEYLSRSCPDRGTLAGREVDPP